MHGYCILFITLIQCFNLEGLTFDVTTYGAYPNDGIDDSNATQIAIHLASTNGSNNIVLFQSGTYDFSSLVYIYSAVNLTVMGQGMQQTLLLGHAPTTIFVMMNCQRLTIGSFAIDFNPLPFTAGYVVNVASSYLDMQVVSPHQPDVGQTVRTILRYDPILMRPAIGSAAYEIYQTPPPNVYTSLVSNNTLRIPLAFSTNFAVGDAIVVRYSFTTHAFYGRDVTDLTMISITIYTAWYFGIYASRARRLNMIDYHVKPRNGRWLSTSADCMHFGDSREFVNIFDSSCEAQGDDGLNVQAFVFTISQVLNSSALIIQTSNWPDTLDVGIGTNLEFSPTSKPFSPYATAIVASTTLNNSNYGLFTFTNPINASVGDRACVVDASFLTIRNLTVANNRARGLLLSTQNIEITQSLFNRTSGPAILLQPSLYWHEGPAPRNVLLNQNVYINCNEGIVRHYGVITMMPEPIQVVSVMYNIQIKSSTFLMGQYSGSMIQCANCKDVSIHDNYLSTNSSASPVVVCNSQNISAYNNSIINNQSTISQYIMYDATNPCLTNLSSGIDIPASGFNSSFPPPVIVTSSGVQVNVNPVTTSTTTTITTTITSLMDITSVTTSTLLMTTMPIVTSTSTTITTATTSLMSITSVTTSTLLMTIMPMVTSTSLMGSTATTASTSSMNNTFIVTERAPSAGKSSAVTGHCFTWSKTITSITVSCWMLVYYFHSTNDH